MNAFRSNGIVVFLSDFGLRDAYPAEVHGALVSRFPGVRIVDATHEIPPQDLRSGAFVLRRVAPSFPAGTVFLAVVDPGVGTSRRPLVATNERHVFVGPDNGLLSWAAGDKAEWRLLSRPDLASRTVAPTFHGRDLFGPVAATLAAGSVLPSELGPVVPDPIVLSFPGWTAGDRHLAGTVVYVDRFGNLVLSIPVDAMDSSPVEGSTVVLRLDDSRKEATWGPYGCSTGLSVHPDSSGLVEVALSNGRANAFLRRTIGDPVEFSW